MNQSSAKVFSPSEQGIAKTLERARLLAAARCLAGILIFSRVLLEISNQNVQRHDWLVLPGIGYAIACLLIWILLRSPLIRRWEQLRRYIFAMLLLDVVAYCIPAVTAWFPREDWVLVFGFTALTAGMFLQRRQALAFISGVSLILVTSPWLRNLRPEVETIYYSAYLSIALMLLTWAISELNQLAVQAEQDSARSRYTAARLQETNALALRALPVGVLVINENYQVEQLNPAAQRLFFPSSSDMTGGFEVMLLPGGAQIRSWLLSNEQKAEQPEALNIELQDGRRLRLTLYHDNLLFQTPVHLVFVQDRAEMDKRVQEQKLVSMGRLAASVAHEVRNPLAAISQSAELLEEFANNSPQQKRLLELIRINCNRIEHTVKDVLDLGGPRDVQPNSVLIRDALEDVLTSMQMAANRVEVVMQDSQVRVMFDPTHFNRVMVNLLSNAGRHASRAEKSIRLTVEGQGQATRMIVENDGAPISDHVMLRLFEPFNTSRIDGSGLGLYICTELCHRNHARISYKANAEGIFTNVFTIDFSSMAQSV